jgi:hypothetical protein
VEKVQWTAEDFEGYFTARRVVMGAKALIDKRRREEGDIVCLAFWILKGWNKGLKALIKQKKTDAEQQDWVAGFTIMWWTWAQKGDLRSRPGDFPVDNLSSADVAPSDDELDQYADVSGDEELHRVETVLGDDGLIAEGDLLAKTRSTTTCLMTVERLHKPISLRVPLREGFPMGKFRTRGHELGKSYRGIPYSRTARKILASIL